MPPVKVFWHDGCKETPQIPGVPEGEILGDLPRFGAGRGQGQTPPPPNGFVGAVFNYEAFQTGMAARAENEAAQQGPRRGMPAPDGSLFIGDKGMLTTGTYGENTRLIPVERMKDYKFPPELLTRSPGHYRDWIRACKGGDPACSNFSVAGPMTEWILLGVLSLRFEGKLEWDSAKMRVTNVPEANKYIKPMVRKGWSLT